MIGEDLLHETPHVFPDGEIGSVTLRLFCRHLAGDFSQAALVATDKADYRTLLSESARDGFADAAACASYKNRLTGKNPHA